jgi:hypothetical protein
MWWSHNSLKESTWACDAYAAAHDRRQRKHGRARPRRPLASVLWRCWTDRVPYHPAVHLKDQADEQTTA